MFPISLAATNPALKDYDIVNPFSCQDYINTVLFQSNGKVANGGYLEKRDLYKDKDGFSGDKHRNVHLGIDFWAKASTAVQVPLDGVVHSFQNNSASGDYGPTIIMKHQIGHFEFHSLYGHLSMDSLVGLYIGKPFKKGAHLASLGTSDINVNYAPHLHFQLIIDMEGHKGDYPGVCNDADVDFYIKNCPNPQLLLNM